jgi:hypothetical protein
MSYAWIDAGAGLTIDVLIRRKSDMAVWDGDSWEDASTLTDAQLEACAISATAETNGETPTPTHLGYKVDIPDGVTVEAELFAYSGGYSAGDVATWQGEYEVASGGDATEAKQDTIIGHLTGIKGDGWSDATDTLEDIRDAVDSIEGGSGSGARTVVITVNDGSDPLESATVRMTQTFTYTASTDASGECTFNLDDATYTVAISKSGYTYSGTTLVVDGDETATYSMSELSISAPAAANLCTVQFRVKLSNTAVEGAVCKAKLLGINQATDGTILSNAESSDTTDSDGIAELQLVQKGDIVKGDGVYKMWVEISGEPVASVETTIPNQSTCLFEDLL